MNKIGIVKEIDALGRLCIPKEMRKLFGLNSEVSLIVTEEGILIQNPEFVLVKKCDIPKDLKKSYNIEQEY